MSHCCCPNVLGTKGQCPASRVLQSPACTCILQCLLVLCTYSLSLSLSLSLPESLLVSDTVPNDEHEGQESDPKSHAPEHQNTDHGAAPRGGGGLGGPGNGREGHHPKTLCPTLNVLFIKALFPLLGVTQNKGRGSLSGVFGRPIPLPSGPIFPFSRHCGMTCGKQNTKNSKTLVRQRGRRAQEF